MKYAPENSQVRGKQGGRASAGRVCSGYKCETELPGLGLPGKTAPQVNTYQPFPQLSLRLECRFLRMGRNPTNLTKFI